MSGRQIPVEPLTQAAFAPFGTVIDKAAVAPRPMNAGRARRFHDLAQVAVAGADGQVVIGFVEAEPYTLPLSLSLVERHPLGAQAFIPLNAAPFLVVVCPDEGGRPGRPRAFLTAPSQGVCYALGTWHGVLTPLERPQDFWVIDRGGPGVNLEEHPFDEPWIIAHA
ncbi:UNVERIFIED_ORG: ureidoglycolate lyase [Methylobacterium sp. SuP10 SLI 274]|uniref:ureidoglycolate lyase n=1 Tax=Methylorubrum extorquens TaxID=408 RepID=UPI00209F4CAC|nr:ureidoglycolate lyase [Methylorubrum extorquens]MDF9865984.1 ureidoglycolate lyase [Methylorubrum pseudosasae]MDH6639536.1 ureidoglycolate lyase [Methylobacterium sp. SuP10 SLI 274]MDH6668731.1 ureidoglycolate lyase [Methylorubrum zatmanii]MCP1560611.1 ureidoglycolate lyase [Methylorubrum extorquens]MDF9794283.1 ureidoglycolate lyase [Methylorubrum extorquens]